MKTTTSDPTTMNPFRAGSFSSAVMVAITAFTIVGTAQTSANNYNWTGGVDGDWNDAGNWDIGIPGNYQHNLIFSGTSNTATNNDIGGSFGKITFSNTTAGQSFNLGGVGLNLYGTVSTAAVVGGGTIEDTISLSLRTTAGTRTFNMGTDHNLTVNGVIHGPQGIIKTGDGKLTLAAANSHGGSATINGGTLAIAAGGTTAEYIPIVINNTGTLHFDRNDTWGDQATDTSSSITINAGGTMESGGYFNTIRDLNLNGGTVAMTGGVSELFPALALKGTITVGGSQGSQINTISGTNNMINIGDGSLGATVFNVADATGDASADLSVNAVLQNNINSGGNSITKTGAGTMVMSSNNTYTGATTINEGTLAFAGSGTISESSAIVINDTATLRFDRNDTWGNAGTDTSSSITINAGGTMESNGFFTTIRDLNLNGGTVALTGGANATYPALALKGTVTVGGSQASQINYVSGSFSRIGIGDGNLGATVFDVADATGDASADLTIGAVIQNNSPVSGNSLTKTGAGTMELTRTNTYTGTTTVNGGTLRIVNSSAGNAILGSHNYSVASGATLEFSRTGGTDSPGTLNLSGAGTFKKSGSEEIIQTSAGSNVNMGSGALFHVESGIYRFGANGTGDWSSNLSDMQVDSGATFNGAATPTVVDALNGSGTVITSGGMTVGVDNGTGSFSGVIADGTHSGTPSFTKNGSGTQTLSGDNTYTGTTTINNGTLIIDGNQASATGAMTVNVNGSLAGSGTIGASLLTVNGVLAPGNSPGTLATGAQLWNDGGSYLWEINNSDGTKGADEGWDFLDITGALDLTNLSAGGFTIDIDSLTTANLAGAPDGFDTFIQADGTFDYEFTIATASAGVSGFDASLFTLDTSGFSKAPGWDWQIKLTGNDLVLEAYAVPEPSSTALLGLGGLALMLRRKR